MQELKIFENPEFGQVRTVEIDGELWFVGRDVCNALGYVNPRDALRKHVDREDRRESLIPTPSRGNQKMTVINESGMYSLMIGSRLETAKRFKRWITSEVLTQLCQRGSYSVRPEQGQLTELIEKQVADMITRTVPVIVSETVKQIVPAVTGQSGKMQTNAVLPCREDPAVCGMKEGQQRKRTRVVSKVDYLPQDVKREVIGMLLDLESGDTGMSW